MQVMAFLYIFDRAYNEINAKGELSAKAGEKEMHRLYSKNS